VADAVEHFTIAAAQAQADSINTGALADAAFDNHVAVTTATFRVQSAQAQVAWVATTAEAQRIVHIARYTQAAYDAYEDTLESAAATRDNLIHLANVLRVAEIADAVVDWTADQGAADIQLADDLGTARVVFVTSVTAAANTYAAARETATNDWTDQVTAAETLHDNTVAQKLATWTGQIGTAKLAYNALANAAEATLVESAAGAEADYTIAIADAAADAAAALAQSEQTDAAQSQSDYAPAFVLWLLDTEQDFIDYRTGKGIAQNCFPRYNWAVHSSSRFIREFLMEKELRDRAEAIQRRITQLRDSL
jgi:hypothetical protein